MQNRSAQFALLFPVAAVFIWSLNIAVTRYAADFISPVSISFYRWLVAFVLLTPFLVMPFWRHRALVLQCWKQLALLSAFGMVLYQGLAYSAAHYTTAIHMGLINALTPVFTIAVSIVLLKEWPNRYAAVGCFISLCGLLLVIAQGQQANLLDLGSHAGDLIMLAAVFLYAFYGILLKKWQLQLPLFVSLYVQIIFALLYHLPFVLWLGLDGINMQNASSVIYAGIFASIFAPLLWMMAVQHLGPSRTSIFMNLMPVFTALIAYFWLAETWGIYHTLGTGLTILGVLLAQRSNQLRKNIVNLAEK